MNVLDIDLDFFLDRSVHNRADEPSNRPDDQGIIPWQAREVANFVETTLFRDRFHNQPQLAR